MYYLQKRIRRFDADHQRHEEVWHVVDKAQRRNYNTLFKSGQDFEIEALQHGEEPGSFRITDGKDVIVIIQSGDPEMRRIRRNRKIADKAKEMRFERTTRMMIIEKQDGDSWLEVRRAPRREYSSLIADTKSLARVYKIVHRLVDVEPFNVVAEFDGQGHQR